MLSYIIEKHLREKWIDLNVTVEEGIHELSSINCITVQVGAVKYNSIPTTRELGSELIRALWNDFFEYYSLPGNKCSHKKKTEC